MGFTWSRFTHCNVILMELNSAPIPKDQNKPLPSCKNIGLVKHRLLTLNPPVLQQEFNEHSFQRFMTFQNFLPFFPEKLDVIISGSKLCVTPRLILRFPNKSLPIFLTKKTFFFFLSFSFAIQFVNEFSIVLSAERKLFKAAKCIKSISYLASF